MGSHSITGVPAMVALAMTSSPAESGRYSTIVSPGRDPAQGVRNERRNSPSTNSGDGVNDLAVRPDLHLAFHRSVRRAPVGEHGLDPGQGTTLPGRQRCRRTPSASRHRSP